MNAVPFAMAANQPPPKINGTRIVEALVIAIVTALAAAYVTTARLEERIDSHQRQLDRIERQLDRLTMRSGSPSAFLTPHQPNPDPAPGAHRTLAIIDRPQWMERRRVAFD